MSAQSVQSSLSVSQGSPTALSQSGLGNLTIENTALDQYYEKWPKDFFSLKKLRNGAHWHNPEYLSTLWAISSFNVRHNCKFAEHSRFLHWFTTFNNWTLGSLNE